MGKWRGLDGVFFFLAMLYQSLKRGEVRHLMATLIWTHIFSYAKLKDFTYGLLWYCMHVNWWRSITVWILPHLHNLYVSITQSLDNIEMRCNRGLQTSRTLKTEKKGKNGTQFVFCKCIIRFFSQLCKNSTGDWFSWRFPNDSCKWEKTFFFVEAMSIFLANLGNAFGMLPSVQEKLTFNGKWVV